MVDDICDNLSLLENGNLLCNGTAVCNREDMCNETDECKFTCNFGYELTGNGTSMCLNGNWTDNEVTCVRKSKMV